MNDDLKNYEPESPAFILPDDCPFPAVIFEGAVNMDDIKKFLGVKFVSETVTNGTAERELDDYEKQVIRKEYCDLVENEVPKRELELVDAKSAAKETVKGAKDRLIAIQQQVKDLAYQVKRGIREVELPKNTVRLPLNGHYLYYAWVNGQCRLVRVDKIPEWESQQLFSNYATNRQAFRDVLGIEIDETEETDNEPTAAQEGEAE